MTLRNEANPPLSPWVRIFFVLVAAILLGGVGLLVVPALVTPRWLWDIAPFNARFLGAIYLTELSVAILFLIYNRRSPARVVLPSALVFVALVSIETFFYLDRFNLQRRATIAWFVVYLGPTVLLAILLLRYRDLLASVVTKLPHPWPALVTIEASLLLIYGIGLLAAPALFTSFWPWTVDAFHARMYSAFFLSLAVAAFVLARAAGKLDTLAVGVAQTVTGLAVIIGFLAVEVVARRANWLAVNTWLWLAMFAVIALIGLLLIGISREEYMERVR